MAINFRRGSSDDNFSVYRIHHLAITELLQRLGISENRGAPTAEEIAQEVAHEWEEYRSLYEHLAESAEHFWVAEQEGELVGYSRATLYDGVRLLNEFFVLPGLQAKGVGQELLSLAFPDENARLRVIIATLDIRAQSLYMRSGLYARALLYHFSCRPQAETNLPELGASDLVMEAAPASSVALPLLAELDRAVLGFQRDSDHRWLLSNRQGWLYRRQGEVVGYGYTGEGSGPFALQNPADFPVVLAHAEQQAAAAGHEEFGLWVLSLNRHVIDYLMARRYRLFPFMAALMSDAPFGRLDHYINTDPPFLM